MSVLVETSLGDIVIDLLVEQAPKACENFLKLCKLKYYNYAPIHSVQKGFSFQTGDPLGPDSKDSDGGSSIWGILEGPSKKNFMISVDAKLKHSERGTVSMATLPFDQNSDRRVAASQFLITLGEQIDHLDGKAAVFGRVVEGLEVLDKIDNAYVDNKGRPLRDIRVRHTVILDDPFPDPPGFREPSQSPVPSRAQIATVRIADDEELVDDPDEVAMEELRREREAKAQALTLEIMGDLPFAEVKPPENVLFVCKLNPVTQDEDLDLIFSRFGRILSCEVIRDKKTGDSLQYAFIEFENKQDCEQAYFKMQSVLIDDHRIHVDFSQSVSRLSDSWRNATNIKRRRQADSNFGGISGLEKRKQYRNTEEAESTRYETMIDRNRLENANSEQRHGSSNSSYPRRSPPRQHRERSRSPYKQRRDRSPHGKRYHNSRSRDHRSRP